MPADDLRARLATPDGLAQLFHDTYERLAPDHGYETRKASAVPWQQVPENNKSLMTAVAAHVLAVLAVDPGDLPARMAAAIRCAAHFCDGRCDCAPGDHDVFAVRIDSDAVITGVEGTPEALARVFMGVENELVASLAARVAEAERRAEFAEGEHQVTRERLAAALASSTGLGKANVEWQRGHDEAIRRADAAEAQVAALREDAEIAEEKFGEMNEAAIRREKQVAALQRDLAEARADREQLYTSKRETFQALGRETERAEQAEDLLRITHGLWEIWIPKVARAQATTESTEETNE